MAPAAPAEARFLKLLLLRGELLLLRSELLLLPNDLLHVHLQLHELNGELLRAIWLPCCCAVSRCP